MASTTPPPTTWHDLDRNSIVHILSFLDDKSVAAAQLVCRDLHELCNLNSLWARLLQQAYGLRVTADKSAPPRSLKTLYNVLASNKSQYAIRYAGAYTDGGLDDGNRIYWVDNMFVPNSWGSFCSDSSPNVHAVGILKAGPEEVDERLRAHRSFLIQRLRAPILRLFYRNCARISKQQVEVLERVADSALENLSTKSLEMLFLDMAEALGAGMQLGRMMLEGMTGSSTERRVKLQQLATAIIQNRTNYTNCQVVGLDKRPPANLRLHDPNTLRLLASPATHQTAGIVDAVSVSRVGEFTCPVSCGAVFLGTAVVAPAAPLGYVAGLSKQPMVAALQDVKDVETLMAASRNGQLPRVVAHVRGVCYEWVEFQRPGGGDDATSAHGTAAAVGTTGSASVMGQAAASAQRHGSEGSGSRKRDREMVACASASSSGALAGAGGKDSGAVQGAHEGEHDKEHGDVTASGAGASEGPTVWPVMWFRFIPLREQQQAPQQPVHVAHDAAGNVIMDFDNGSAAPGTAADGGANQQQQAALASAAAAAAAGVFPGGPAAAAAFLGGPAALGGAMAGGANAVMQAFAAAAAAHQAQLQQEDDEEEGDGDDDEAASESIGTEDSADGEEDDEEMGEAGEEFEEEEEDHDEGAGEDEHDSLMGSAHSDEEEEGDGQGGEDMDGDFNFPGGGGGSGSGDDDESDFDHDDDEDDEDEDVPPLGPLLGGLAMLSREQLMGLLGLLMGNSEEAVLLNTVAESVGPLTVSSLYVHMATGLAKALAKGEDEEEAADGKGGEVKAAGSGAAAKPPVAATTAAAAVSFGATGAGAGPSTSGSGADMAVDGDAAAGASGAAAASSASASSATPHPYILAPDPQMTSEPITGNPANMGNTFLHARLRQRWAGNVALVKLIAHEDRMNEYGDMHDHANIDVQFVALHGCTVRLQDGVRAL